LKTFYCCRKKTNQGSAVLKGQKLARKYPWGVIQRKKDIICLSRAVVVVVTADVVVVGCNTRKAWSNFFP